MIQQVFAHGAREKHTALSIQCLSFSREAAFTQPTMAEGIKALLHGIKRSPPVNRNHLLRRRMKKLLQKVSRKSSLYLSIQI